MLKFEKKDLSQSDKDLFLGNMVTWGSILTAFSLVVSLLPGSFAEEDLYASSPGTEAGMQVAEQNSRSQNFYW